MIRWIDSAIGTAAFGDDEARSRAVLDVRVLVDGPAAGGTVGRRTAGVGDGGTLHVGRCYHQAPQIDALTYVLSREPLAPGELVRCTAVASDGYDLVAQPTSDIERKVALPVLGR
jgi:hypothetical protein